MAIKKNSIFFAILAITFGTGSAQNCSNKDNCKKCTKSNGCAWHIGPSFTGCIGIDDCDSDRYNTGECFSGRNGCKETCKTQAGNCEDCLGFDALRKNGKKGDCAWFVRGNERPQCIFHKRCNDRGFEDGNCSRGKKGKDNSKICNAPTSCSDINDCKDCLESNNPSNCAWAVHEYIMDGKSKRCVDEVQCEDGGDFGPPNWNCYKGSVISNPKKVCKRIDNEVNPRNDPCSNLDGLCSDCLKFGCSWNRDNRKCYENCTDAPSGSNCEPPPASDDTNDRKLLRFDSQESMMCFYWDYEDQNAKLCRKAGQSGDCETCVETPQIIPPGITFIKQPTCYHLPDTGECVATCPGGGVECRDVCFNIAGF